MVIIFVKLRFFLNFYMYVYYLKLLSDGSGTQILGFGFWKCYRGFPNFGIFNDFSKWNMPTNTQWNLGYLIRHEVSVLYLTSSSGPWSQANFLDTWACLQFFLVKQSQMRWSNILHINGIRIFLVHFAYSVVVD